MIATLMINPPTSEGMKCTNKQHPQINYRTNNLQKDTVSFGDGGLTLIFEVARGARGVAKGWSFLKKEILMNQLNKVIVSPGSHTQSSLAETLVALTKLDDKENTKGILGIAKLFVTTSDSPYIETLRRKAARSNFMNKLDDNVSQYKQVKKDFFRDYINNAYKMNQYGFAEHNGLMVDLTSLSDYHYKSLKEDIGETLLNSRSYIEKHKDRYGAGGSVNSTVEEEHVINTCDIISKFDKNLYKDFLRNNKNSYIEKLKIAMNPEFSDWHMQEPFPYEKRKQEYDFMRNL